MKKQSPFKIVLEATCKVFDENLKKYGFSEEHEKITYGLFIRRWTRNFEWKIDTIEIRYRRGGELDIKLNFEVLLPTQIDNEKKLKMFSGIGIITPYVPHSFAKLRSNFYANKVLKLLRNKLEWFAEYSTPEKCLAKVDDQKRNGPRKCELLDGMISNLGKLI
jgi:hypothetical protein